MNKTVRNDIISLLQNSLTAIKNGDSFRLKELSNTNIHNASIFQDEDSLSISVVIYALSKIIDHTPKKKAILSHLQKALTALQANNDNRYRQTMKALIKAVRVEDYRLKKFVSSVIDQAQLKKGCALCEHGLSVEHAANIFGISRWELMQYLGKTQASEQSSERIPTEQRLSLARSLFR